MEPGYYDLAFHRGRGIQRFWQRQRLRLVRECLPPDPGRVIDLGCGPGTFLGNFFDGREALGVDFASPQIEYALRRYGRPGLEFRQGDILEFRHESPFDCAVSIETIEHLPRDKTARFLGNARRLLKPGGSLVLVTPNYASAWPIIEWGVSKLGPVDYSSQHINPFTRARLVEEVARAGFAIDRLETFFVVAPFLAAFSARAAQKVLEVEASLFPRFGAEMLLVGHRTEEPSFREQ
jgi:SAM-dependent methyltransferase